MDLYVGDGAPTSLDFMYGCRSCQKRNIYRKIYNELSCLVTDRDVEGAVPYNYHIISSDKLKGAKNAPLKILSVIIL